MRRSCLDNSEINKLVSIYYDSQKKNRTMNINIPIEYSHSLIDELTTTNINDLKNLFHDLIQEVANQSTTADLFINIFDNKINEIMDERKQNIKISLKLMLSNSNKMVNKWKQSLYSQFKSTDFTKIHQIAQNVIQEIENKYLNGKDINAMNRNRDKVAKLTIQQKNIEKEQQQIKLAMQVQQEGIQKLMQKQQDEINRQHIMYLEKCKNELCIKDIYELNSFKSQITNYDRYNQDYRIFINFGDDDNSLNNKQQVMKLIDQMNVNHKVAAVLIKVDHDNPIDSQLILDMIDRYKYMYCIHLYDYSDSVDDVHQYFKQLIKQSTLLMFGLYLRGNLKYHDQGFQLIKEYNQLINDKQYLQYLHYEHDKITKECQSKQEIYEIIEKVDKI